MRTDKIYTIVFWAGLMAIWSMSAWGGWAERTYEKTGERSPRWFWLRLLGIPTSRDNCVRFVKGVSLFAMGVVTVMLVVILVLGE